MKNVFTNVTWKTLKKNRTRTLVTIIGILLAAAMLTAGHDLHFKSPAVYDSGIH